MDSDAPRIISTFKLITDRFKCVACGHLLKEPQKGVCSHIACARCWGSSGRKCSLCNKSSGPELRPDKNLSEILQVVLRLADSIKDSTGIDVLSNSEDDNSGEKGVDPPEFFFDVDMRYSNTKTYKGNSPLKNSPNPEFKVNEWLKSPTNSFEQRSKRVTRPPQKYSPPAGSKSKTSDGETSSEKSVIKNAWSDVKKIGKTLRRPPSKSKLNVCVKSSVKLDMSEKIELSESNEDVESSARDGSDPEIVLDKDDLALREVERNESLSEPVDRSSSEIDAAHSLSLLSDENFTKPKPEICKLYESRAEDRKNSNGALVPFIFKGKLAMKRRPIPFYYRGGLSVESSVVECCSKHYFLSCANCRRSVDDPPVLSASNRQTDLHFNKSTKRQMDASHDDEHNYTVKRSKLNNYNIRENNDLVVQFESQTQDNSSSPIVIEDEVRKSPPMFKKMQDEKLMAIKKSVDIYMQNESFDKSVTQKSTAPENASNVDCFDSVVEDTPRKSRSIKIIKSFTKDSSKTSSSSVDKSKRRDSEDSSNKSCEEIPVDMDLTLVSSPKAEDRVKIKSANKKVNTPASMLKFQKNIKHQSTPLQTRSRRSLAYNLPQIKERSGAMESEEVTQGDKTNLEKEFMEQAFEKSVLEERRSAILTCNRKNKMSNRDMSKLSMAKPKKKDVEREVNDNLPSRISIVCSLLTLKEREFIKNISSIFGWKYEDEFTKDTTHLVVKVNENNMTERSVKYVQAVAKRCWVVSYAWIEECSKMKSHVKEDDFEAIDESGNKGPYTSRTSKNKIFDGITIHCMDNLKIIPRNIVEEIIIYAGGSLEKNIKNVRINDPKEVKIVLSEVDNNDTSIDETMSGIVPVTIEWLLDSVGAGKCRNIYEYVMVDKECLPKIDWSSEIFEEVPLTQESM